MSIVSENLRYLRKINGLTQEQLATRLGTKRPNIGAYEESRATPPRETLIRVSKLFGVSIDQFLKTDLRKIREIPSLSLRPESPPLPEAETPPSLGRVVEQFYREQPPARPASVPQEPPVFQRSQESTLFDAPPPARPYAPPVTEPEGGGAPLVRADQWAEYPLQCPQAAYVARLPRVQVQLPGLRAERVFEAGDDFPMPAAWLCCEALPDWHRLEDGQHYLLVTKHRGLLYRRVYNQLKIKQSLVLSSDMQRLATFELPAREVVEIWRVRGFLSTQVPEPSVSLERVKELLDELRAELRE